MENVAMTALQTDPMQLLVLGMGLLALAIVIQSWFNSRANNNTLGVMTAQVKVNSDLTQATMKQTDALRTEQDLRREQIGATNRLAETVTQQHTTIVEKLEKEAEASAKRIETLQTDLVGATGKLIDASAEKLASELSRVLTPLNENMGIIRTGLDLVEQRRIEEQERRRIEDERYKADMAALWGKAADTQQQLRQTVQDTIERFLGGQRETAQQHIVGDRPDTLPDTGRLGDPGAGPGRSPGDSADGAAAGDLSAGGAAADSGSEQPGPGDQSGSL